MMLQSIYGLTGGRSFTTKLAIISAWFAVFIPGHFYGWLVERSYSVLLFVIAVASIVVTRRTSTNNYIGQKNNIILFMLLAITVLYVFSTILTYFSSPYVLTIRDVLDLFRYIVYGAVFVIMGNAEADRLRIAAENLILVSLSFSLVVLFVYLVDVPLITDIVQWFYVDTKTGISFPHRVRLAAPFENPNFLAFYVILCFSYSLFLLSGKRRIILTSLVLIVLAATGSRSGWAAAGLIVVGLITRVLLGVHNSNRTILWQDIRVLIFFSLVLSCLLWNFYPYLLESSRVQLVLIALEDGGLFQEPNVASRLDMVAETFRLISQRPMFGWGPLKGGSLEVIDNQYTLVMARQGLLGFILIMSIMLYIFSGAIKFADTWAGKIGLLFMFLAVAVMLITGAFLNNFRLFTLFIFFVIAFTGKRVMNDCDPDIIHRSSQN